MFSPCTSGRAGEGAALRRRDAQRPTDQGLILSKAPNQLQSQRQSVLSPAGRQGERGQPGVEPVMVGFLGMTDYQDRAKSLAVAGNYAYVGFDARSSLWRHLLQVIDISDPTQPVVVSSQGDGGVIEALSIEEDRLYAAPIRVYDLSGDPALPREMASLPIPIYSLSVSVAAEGATIYLSNHSGGLVSIGTAPVTESLRFPLMLKSR